MNNTASSANPATLERQTTIRIWRRTVPLMMVVIFLGYLDRANLSFAAITMNQDLGLSNTAFGTAAGVFAIGYMLFAIPSTLLLHRLGARRWIAVMMVVWGACSAATAFVAQAHELLVLRVLLGMAEAGLAPGAVVYLSTWFPGEYRGRVLGSLFVINPLSQLMGGPLSSVLLTADGQLGLAGWQWLFIVEGLPTVLLAAVVFYALPDKPDTVSWLSDSQRQWLTRQLSAGQPSSPDRGRVFKALTHRRVWILATAGLCIGTCGIGSLTFLPLMIRSMGFSVWNTGFIAAVPAAAAAITLPLWGIWADRTRSREGVVAVGCGAMACGFLGTAVLLPSAWAIVPMSVALAAFFGCLAAFWALPASFLMGAGAAAGIAFINVAGNLGQFIGPYLLGRMADLSRSHSAGLTCLAGIAALAVGVMASQIKMQRSSAVEMTS